MFDGTSLQRPVTCQVCEKSRAQCACPRGADGEVLFPKDQPLSISSEKRRKGGIITLVRGLDPSASDLNAVARRLKSACAAGGTVTPEGIEVQGDHSQRVATILQGLGYPTRVHGREPSHPKIGEKHESNR